MAKRLNILLTILLFSMGVMQGEIINPVKWTSSVKMSSPTTGTVSFTAKIDKGWHVYATDIPENGPVPLSVKWTKLNGVKLNGKLTPSRTPHEEMDKTFGMNLRWWTDNITIIQRFTLTGKSYDIGGSLHYMSCNDVTCQSPASEPFSFKNTPKDDAASDTASAAVKDTLNDSTATVATPASGDSISEDQLWQPVNAENGLESNNATHGSRSLWYIFFTCFLGGLLALLTPCVWPMIPLTVSFFLKKSGSRAKSISNAIIYGLSIIIIYLLLGLLVTAIFGASSLNALATNAICNIIFFLMLVVFAISFFGAFDIKLPDSWSNKMDSTAEKTTGLLSIFFMAFTLAIVSFSCTGPIIGTLIVEAASMGNLMGPAIGMFGFALALAIPFSFFALFPSLLKKLPKSGGWLNSVKVVLGFIELALSLKFLSVADLAYGWHILDREVFLSLWIVMFLLLGLYLLGIIRFKSDSQQNGIGVFRFFLAMISLAFTVYLVPGLWGAPLKATSSFVPPLYTQDFNLYGEELSEYDDFNTGMKAAAKGGKPVFVDFSGYGCVNCRKMEGAVLDNSKVKESIKNNFITIKLMVDDKKNMPQPIYVEENGRQVELDNYGDMWSYLQRHKFKSNSQPYYVILNAKGELLSGPFVYDENIDRFMDFLNKGLEANKNGK
jgi:thiol:disulfide interchange protein